MIRPDDLLSLADDWIANATEAEWRSAVSRAYYGAFHAARDLFVDLGFAVPRGAQAHAYLWIRLSNCGDPSLVQAGADLADLLRRRNFADYDIQLDLDQSTALTWVQLARAVSQQLAGGHVEPVRSQITAAIRDYERNVLRNVTWQGP